MGKKVTFSLFPRKFENGPFLAHFDQNWPKFGQKDQKWWFFTYFLKTAHWNFLIFCTKPSLWSWKNIPVSLFWRKFKKDPFCLKLTQIRPKFGHSWKSWKNLKVGVLETAFKQVQFIFRQTTCTYSESWGPVEIAFDLKNKSFCASNF